MIQHDDPIDEMAAVTLARYAVSMQALTAAAIAAGLPELEVRKALDREREKFIAELAAGVTTLRQMCDDPDAPRH